MGDEVLLPAPYWTTYPETIKLAGGVPVPVVADITSDYKVTVEALEAARPEDPPHEVVEGELLAWLLTRGEGDA